MAVSRWIKFLVLPIGIATTIMGLTFTIFGRVTILPDIVKQVSASFSLLQQLPHISQGQRMF